MLMFDKQTNRHRGKSTCLINHLINKRLINVASTYMYAYDIHTAYKLMVYYLCMGIIKL